MKQHRVIMTCAYAAHVLNHGERFASWVNSDREIDSTSVIHQQHTHQPCACTSVDMRCSDRHRHRHRHRRRHRYQALIHMHMLLSSLDLFSAVDML